MRRFGMMLTGLVVALSAGAGPATALPAVSTCDGAWAAAGACAVVEVPGPNGVAVTIEGAAHAPLDATLDLRLREQGSGAVLAACRVRKEALPLAEARCTATGQHRTTQSLFIGICEVKGEHAGLFSCSARPI